MNTNVKDILKCCREIDRMLDNGDIQDAVMLSGEKLAIIDSLWTGVRNNKQPSIDEISTLAIIASYHAQSLAMMGDNHNAYATAVTVLFQIAYDGNISLSLSQSSLMLYITAITSLMEIVNHIHNDDDSVKEHIEAIMRYLASLLYYQYNIVNKSNPSFPHLSPAYHLLRMLNVESPTITVLDKKINPETSLPVFSDLMGRSKAMGFLDD